MIFNKKFVFAFILLLSLYAPFSAWAQPDPGCDPQDPTCPIDGGISLLIAAGLGLGARQALKKKSEE